MSQSKDESKLPAEGGKKYSAFDRFSDMQLFLISALAIFFSPFGFFGLFVPRISSLVQNNLLSWTVEAIFFIVGFIPFATLGDRREYTLMAMIATFAIINLGIAYFAYFLFSVFG